MNDENDLLKNGTEDETEDMNTDTSDNDESPAGIYILKKPFEIDGEKITKIEYDFDAVKPIQYKNLVTRLSKKGQIAVPELDNGIQFSYFSLACGIPVSELMRMPSTQDYTVICSMVRNFLLGVSDTEKEEE